MRITKLRLTGFKSFVEPTELRIEPGLTGVVGPNGCGKSNLLEAIRWVMGEGSPKSLRGGGMEDVIFAGTATRPPRDFAEVSILVDGGSDGDGGGGEREVVRRIERGAGSAYRMDGRDVRQRDVALVFADAATGAHSPALVSQNRIGAIIAARPAERRQMLEEAAGIAGLHVRRKDAETRLRATEANLARLDELLADMAARAAALRRQARTAGRYRALSDAIRTAEARMLWARWRDAAAAAERAQADAAAAEAAVGEAAEAQRAAAAHQTEAARLRDAARTAAATAREASAAARQREAALRTERDAAARRLAELARLHDAIRGDRAREDMLARDAAAAGQRLAAEDAALAAALAAAEETQAELAARVAAAERAAAAAEAALGQAVAAQARDEAERRIAAAQVAAARARLARAAADAARIAREAAALADPGPLAAEHAAASDRAEAAAAAIATAQATLAESERARTAAAAARDAAEVDGAAARAALAALEAEAQALAAAVARGGRDRVLAQVRAAPGYERALAAALGDDLDATLGDGPRAWTGAAPRPDDPPLAAGLASLGDHVAAPAALARRLRQIGVAAADDGAVVLAVGQRLVTLDGRLRRWDGYVARDAGAAAAETLIRVNRLDAIHAALPPAQAALAEARAASEAAAAAVAAAAAQGSAARAALGEAEAARRQALRAADAAAGARERLALQRAAIDERSARAAAEQDDAAAAARDAEAAQAMLPDGQAAAAAVVLLRGGSGTAQAALATVRGEAAALVATLARDRARGAAARGEAERWRTRAADADRRLGELGARDAALAAETATLTERPAALAAALAAAADEAHAAATAAAAAQAAEAAAETRAHAAEAAAERAREALSAAREVRAGAAARGESHALRRAEASRTAGERFGCPAPVLPERARFASAEVAAADAEAAAHDRLAAERERLGPVNLVAEAELAELEAAHAAAAADRDELGVATQRLRGSIGSLNREGRQRLRAAFEAVDGHFRRLFATLFTGGEAHLALVDADDPLEAGLEIMAQPPGKRLQSLTLLSGGEQALTAVALIFALFLTNPAPICVLDEVDAPLDDANIERFCDLLDAMTRETATRYLIVTHNAVTMSRMHRLFGVTMIERGVSRLVSVDLGAAETLLAAE